MILTHISNDVSVYLASTLTTGIDTFGNAAQTSQQLFNAANGTFTSLDTLTGGLAANDTLNIANTGAFATPVGATVTNVDIINLTTSGGGVINTAASNYTGVKTLNVSSAAAAMTVTAAGTTAVNVTNATPGNAGAGASATTVNGGSNVSATVTGGAGSNDTITIGATTAATGTVTASLTTSTTNATGGAVAVTGGTTVNVTSLMSNTAAGVNVQAVTGAIGVTGNATTTAVTVTQSAGVTGANAVAVSANASNAVAATRGVTNAAVTIADANASSATAAATITTVTLQNYANSTISSNALTTLNLSNTGTTASGTLGLTYGLTTGNPTSLALNLGGGSLGAITDVGNKVATVNVALTAASTLDGITDTALRTVNLSGTGVLTLTNVNTAITAITNTSAAAGLTANVSGLTGLTSLNFASTSANNTITLNSTTQTYTGGTGNDVITISADATKAITGGTGVDTIVLGAATGTFTVANTGANVTGFETVGFNAASTGAYALNTIGLAANATAVSLLGTAAGSLTVTGLAAGTNTVNINAAQNGLTNTFQYAGTAGAATAVTLNLNGSTVTAANGGGTAGFTAGNGTSTGTIVIQDANAVGVGTINLVSNASVYQGLMTVTALNNTATSALTNLNITGSGSVTIGGVTTAATGLTISDNGTGTSATADGITTLTGQGDVLGSLNYSGTHAFTIGTLANSVANLTVTNANTGTSGVLTIGGHTDNSLASLTLVGSVAYTGSNNSTAAASLVGGTNNSAVNVTWNGAGGIKTITLGNGANTVVTGTAADVITVGTGANTITGAAGADAITVAAGHTSVDRFILNSVVGTSTDSGQVVVAGQGNDTGADVYTNVNLATDVFRVVSTTVGNFNQGTNTVIGTAGAATDGSAAAFTTSTGLIYLNGDNATFGAGNVAVTFASPSATLSAANFRSQVQYDLTTATGSANAVVTGVLNDVLRANTQANANADTFTGGNGADNFVFGTAANVKNAMAGANTTLLMDKVTDFAVGTDKITLGTGAAAFGTGVTFTAATTTTLATGAAAFAGNAADIDALTALMQGSVAGTASTSAVARAYIFNTGTMTNANFSNKTFLVINDATNAIDAADAIIDITGLVGTFTAADIQFGTGTFIA